MPAKNFKYSVFLFLFVFFSFFFKHVKGKLLSIIGKRDGSKLSERGSKLRSSTVEDSIDENIPFFESFF